MKKATAILLAVACHIVKAETPNPTILQCHIHETGRVALVPPETEPPDDSWFPPPFPAFDFTFRIEDNALFTGNIRTPLCSTSSTTYIFATYCHLKRSDYISDWLGSTYSKDPTTIPFYKKYSGGYPSTTVIDRVNLTIEEETLTNRWWVTKDSKTRPFVLSVRTFGNCEIVKPKF
ncbi:hypothetical protein M3I54_39970 [Paraburkholderia sp. CNPSo 3274]|nr:hypothetical protein [Paraburkholderia sp. CNPSo 3274]